MCFVIPNKPTIIFFIVEIGIQRLTNNYKMDVFVYKKYLKNARLKLLHAIFA